MKYLYIDTSSSYLYSAIVDDTKVLSEVKEEYGQSLSVMALPKIAELFSLSGLEPKDIDKIIVVNGPGSFTGIRIGLTIAKTYAWSLNIPISTICALESMSLSSDEKCFHVPIINARRGFVYAAIYDDNYKEVLKPQHIELAKLFNILTNYKEYEIITNDYFDELKNTTAYTPDILKVVNYYKDKKTVNPHIANPEYLKLTEAEENKND